MTKLSFQIKPGHSLGPFQLGMPIAQILEILESIERDIKRAEIEFNPQVIIFYKITTEQIKLISSQLNNRN